MPGPKVFTVSESNTLLSTLEEILTKLDQIRARLKLIKNKMDVLEMIYGSSIVNVEGPDRREYQGCLEEVERIRKEFEATVAEITQQGGFVKSVEEGLVDFYGVVDHHLVWLCWKRGETEVRYYHHLEEGFSGRQPIPMECQT